MNILAFMMPGPTEMVIIGIVAILLFGKRLPGVARSVGQSVFELKRGLSEAIDGEQDATTRLPEVSQSGRTDGSVTGNG
jgi:sec-independent protein translocase protein TatA